MDFLNKLLNCEMSEIDQLVDDRLNDLSNNCEKKKILGFIPGSMNLNGAHKGFIDFNTRIRFGVSSMLDYSMKTRDFYYTIARLVKHYDFKNVKNVIIFLMTFINDYFGISVGPDRREDLQEVILNNTVTDDEYFEAIEKLEIGVFKGKKMAMCTERSAIAQNILSMFGVESYYCMGAVDIEPHCFNVIKLDDSYYLVDYNQLCSCKKGKRSYYVPLLNKIPEEKINDFFNNHEPITLEAYDYIDGKREVIGEKEYVIGKWDLEKSK
jgi:hypothetical protein